MMVARRRAFFVGRLKWGRVLPGEGDVGGVKAKDKRRGNRWGIHVEGTG